MAEFTKPQLNFLARQVIMDELADVPPQFPEEVEAHRLAEEDLERARLVMEEHAAFNHVFAKVALEFPESTKREQQRLARSRIADAEVRKTAVEESRLYDHLLGGS